MKLTLRMAPSPGADLGAEKADVAVVPVEEPSSPLSPLDSADNPAQPLASSTASASGDGRAQTPVNNDIPNNLTAPGKDVDSQKKRRAELKKEKKEKKENKDKEKKDAKQAKKVKDETKKDEVGKKPEGVKSEKRSRQGQGHRCRCSSRVSWWRIRG